MPSWNPFKRRSSVVSQAPINEDRREDPAIFRMVTNPKDVKEQQTEPLTLPPLDSDVHTVRFFLYHVLTFRGNQVAKRWPQWVLETVAAWNGNGTALRDLDGDLSFLCPMSTGYAQLDGKAAYQNSPSGDCRAQIGQVLGTTISRLKAKEQSKARMHQEWKETQKGLRIPWDRPATADNASIHSVSQLPSQSKAASIYLQAPYCNTMPNLGLTYNAHALYTTAPRLYAPSQAASERTMPTNSEAHPQSESAVLVACGSSVKSPASSGDRNSDKTYQTEATSPPTEYTGSLYCGKERQSFHAPSSTNGNPPTQGYFCRAPSSQRSLRPSASFQQPSMSQEEAIVPNMRPPQSVLSVWQWSDPAPTQYAPNQYFSTENLLVQYRNHHVDSNGLSTPSHFHRTQLRNESMHFPDQNFLNYPQSDIFAPRQTLLAPSNPLSNNPNFATNFANGTYILNPTIHSTPLGGISSEFPTTRGTSFRHSRPSTSHFRPSTSHSHAPSHLSHAATARQIPFGSQSRQRTQVPTISSFTGTTRSERTASVDRFALDQGTYLSFKTKDTPERSAACRRERDRMQGMGPSSLYGHRTEPIGPSTRVINPATGEAHKTLFERIEERDLLNGRRSGLSR